MADDLYMRASDADRSRVTNFLSDSLAKGFISTEEMSQRLDVALASKTFVELLPLVKDIPGGKELIKESANAHVRAAHREARSSSAALATNSSPVRHRRGRGSKVIGIAALVLIAWLGISLATLTFKFAFGALLGLFFPVVMIAVIVMVIRSLVRPRHPKHW